MNEYGSADAARDVFLNPRPQCQNGVTLPGADIIDARRLFMVI